MEEIIKRLDKIISLLEHEPSSKENVEICFKAASEKASDEFLKTREKEIFEILDRGK